MAKKKAKKKVGMKQKKTSRKKEKQVEAGKENVSAAKKKNPFIVPVIIAVVLLAIAAEIYFVAQKEMKLNKKPVFVKKWKGTYKSHEGIPVYGQNMYIIDYKQNQIQVYDKTSGSVKTIIETKGRPQWAVETTKGDVLVMISGSNVLKKYQNGKMTGEIALAGSANPVGMAIDSEDNLYVSEHGSNKIIKYNIKGKKLMEFGGRGGSKDKFEKIGKVFDGPEDKIYALDYGDGSVSVRVFTSKGKFVKGFKTHIEQPVGLEKIVIMQDGNMYINDFNGSRIFVYNPGGKLISRFNYDKDGRFKITYPASISGGEDNRLYVASHAMGIFEAIEY